MELNSFQRKTLSKLAHNLKPLVMIGGAGLTEGVVNQTEEMLEKNELIKVKFQDYKSSREVISKELAEKTHATLVRVIGNTAIVYRQARKPENRKIRIPQKKNKIKLL